MMDKISKLVNQFLKQIKFSKLSDIDFKVFKEVRLFKQLSPNSKKQDYDRVADKIENYLSGVNSYMGVLDRNFPIHILSRMKQTPKNQKEIKLLLEGNNSFIIKSVTNRRYGTFSLTKKFVKQYVTHARKNNNLDEVFSQIDILLPLNDTLNLVHLRVENTSRRELIDRIISM